MLLSLTTTRSEPATQAAPKATQMPKRQSLHVATLVAWSANLGSLLTLAWLCYANPSFATSVAGASIDSFLAYRPLFISTCVAILSSVAIIAVTLFGHASARSLRSWIAVTTMCCVWLAALVNWPTLAHFGKRHRLQKHVASFEPIAQALQESWPANDGTRSDIGAFMAYPAGQPSVLILLTLPSLSNTDASLVAIEKGQQQQLRFELAGSEHGDWLEWHPEGTVPASFIGGLRETYQLERFSKIRDNWYLAAYRPLTKGFSLLSTRDSVGTGTVRFERSPSQTFETDNHFAAQPQAPLPPRKHP